MTVNCTSIISSQISVLIKVPIMPWGFRLSCQDGPVINALQSQRVNYCLKTSKDKTIGKRKLFCQMKNVINMVIQDRFS